MTDRPSRVAAWDMTDESVAVLLCTFRLCDWRSTDVRTMHPDEQDTAVREHLLDAHRRELTTLGRVASDAGLINP